MILHPDSNGQPLVEFNPCHGPNDGRFCATATTRVGITSQRPKGDPGHQTGGQVKRSMKAFERELQAIPSVTHVSVKPGTGVWDGGWEPSWIVSYKGNGAARRLLGKTAKAYNQDSVLLMHRNTGKTSDADPAVELHFEGSVHHETRAAISKRLVAEGLTGWTWGRRGKHTVLRAVSVPDWGGKRDKHLFAMGRASRIIQDSGHPHKVRTKYVTAEAWSRDNGDYDKVIGGQ